VTEDLERIGRRLAPEVLRALADHLDHVTYLAKSEIVLHHGPGGYVRMCRVALTTQVLDVRATKGVESA